MLHKEDLELWQAWVCWVALLSREAFSYRQDSTIQGRAGNSCKLRQIMFNLRLLLRISLTVVCLGVLGSFFFFTNSLSTIVPRIYLTH